MASPMLIQVLPKLEPGKCGVSDQAVLIANELRSAFGIETGFLVLNSTELANVPFPMECCQPSHLLDRCRKLCSERPSALLVHLSGYGYSADGAPRLLADALEQVQASSRIPIAIYVHELYAKGMPWTKTFWYSRRQRKAVIRVIESADLLVTSTSSRVEWIERVPKRLSHASIRQLPVISGAGETERWPAYAGREPGMIIFGRPGTRLYGYRRLCSAHGMLQRLGVTHILDVGQECDSPKKVGGIPVKRMGPQPEKTLAEMFSRVGFGFVPYPPGELAKSSVFASFSAHGTIPVVLDSFFGEIDGLIDGVHMASPRTARSIRSAGLESCSRAVWAWYDAHRLRVHAELYSEWLRQAAPEFGHDFLNLENVPDVQSC